MAGPSGQITWERDFAWAQERALRERRAILIDVIKQH